MVEDKQNYTDISWHRSNHVHLCREAELSAELLELHIKYLQIPDIVPAHKGFLKAFRIKLLAVNEPVTLLEKSMDPWQLYRIGHPAWARNLNPISVRFILLAQERIDTNGIEDLIDVKPMLQSGNNLTILNDHQARIHRIVIMRKAEQPTALS